LKASTLKLLQHVRQLEDKFGASETDIANWDSKDQDFIEMRKISRHIYQSGSTGGHRLFTRKQQFYIDNYIIDKVNRGWTCKEIAKNFNSYNSRAKKWHVLNPRWVSYRKSRLKKAGYFNGKSKPKA
jgi:hypothetical protein